MNEELHINWIYKEFIPEILEYGKEIKTDEGIGTISPLLYYRNLTIGGSIDNLFLSIEKIRILLPKDSFEEFVYGLNDKINILKSYATTNRNQIDLWLKKYTFEYQDLINSHDIRFEIDEDNKLYQILKDNWSFCNDDDYYQIQEDFYNYWFGQFIDQILVFLKTINSKITQIDTPQNLITKKVPEKYYALYHCFLIKLGEVSNFEKNGEVFSKQEIMEFAKSKYKFNTSGEGFYKEFVHLDLTNKIAIAKCFKNYKKILIKISGNNHRIIEELQKYPN